MPPATKHVKHEHITYDASARYSCGLCYGPVTLSTKSQATSPRQSYYESVSGLTFYFYQATCEGGCVNKEDASMDVPVLLVQEANKRLRKAVTLTLSAMIDQARGTRLLLAVLDALKLMNKEEK